MATNNTADIGFEKQIWDAACVLWGHIPAADYRKVIIGLIFCAMFRPDLRTVISSSYSKVRDLRTIGIFTTRKMCSGCLQSPDGKPLPQRRILPKSE